MILRSKVHLKVHSSQDSLEQHGKTFKDDFDPPGNDSISHQTGSSKNDRLKSAFPLIYLFSIANMKDFHHPICFAQVFFHTYNW